MIESISRPLMILRVGVSGISATVSSRSGSLLRATPREDLISDLVRAVDRDDRLEDREIIMLVTGLLAAGSTTTAMRNNFV